jgi:hypothetical protein
MAIKEGERMELRESGEQSGLSNSVSKACK